jgi:hypothetical protein
MMLRSCRDGAGGDTSLIGRAFFDVFKKHTWQLAMRLPGKSGV